MINYNKFFSNTGLTTTTTTSPGPLAGSATYGHYDKILAQHLALAQFDSRMETGMVFLIEDISHYDRVARFLEIGGDVDLKLPASFDYPSLNRTLLHWAAFFKQEEVCLLLRDTGASVEIKDDNGKTPLDLAIDNGAERSHPNLIRILTVQQQQQQPSQIEQQQQVLVE
jgi:hypothetical protein